MPRGRQTDRDKGKRERGRNIERDVCCRKGIWSPRGGDLVPKTLPTAEPSNLARGIHGKTTGPGAWVLRDQIPLVRGPNPLLSRPSRKRPWKQSPTFLRNHYFYSGFANFGAFLSGSPKNTKKPSRRECHYPTSFFGFFFVQNRLFCFCLIFTWLLWPTPNQGRS